MKKFKKMLMEFISRIVLEYSRKAIFSYCSSDKFYEARISNELKDEIQNAIYDVIP